jgi:hypothetical protein
MSPYPLLVLVSSLLIGSVSALSAADERHDGIPRLVGEVLIGTAGFEPGIAAEWRFDAQYLLVRPEVILNEDHRPGFGGSVAWDLKCFALPERQSLTVGPRVMYHNSDEYGWGVDAMAIWHFDLVPSQRGRHFLEVIGTVGAIEEEKTGDNDIELGFSAGVAYGFQF